MKQFVLTPAMGKRLIGKGLTAHPAVRSALRNGTLVIVAGTTNGYVAEEVLKSIGQSEGFSRKGFRRGMVTPPHFNPASGEAKFPGDVVIVKGTWVKGREIFDVVNDMGPGDLILKGGNALDLPRRRAAALIAHPMGGTVGATIPAVIGRRVGLIVPIGLEKRVAGDLDELAAGLNTASAEGPRMMPLPGEVFTELDVFSLLTGAEARLVAAGGVCGAEGAVWIAVSGENAQVAAAEELWKSLIHEPACQG
jgi:hypothetical protein